LPLAHNIEGLVLQRHTAIEHGRSQDTGTSLRNDCY